MRKASRAMDALPYGRACSRSEEPMQASLSSRSITAFDDAIARSLERTAVVKITLTALPTDKRKQYDKDKHCILLDTGANDTSHCTGYAVFATLRQVMSDKIHAFSCGTTKCEV